MTHVMGNHHGQHTEEGCQSRHNGLAGKIMSFTYKNEELLTLLLSWPWSTYSTYPIYFNVLQSKSICAFVGHFQHGCESADENFPFPLLLVEQW